MGADIRVKNLEKISLSDYIKYYKSLKLISDSYNFVNSESVLLYNLFKITRVTQSDFGVDSKMMTPKAFLSTIASTDERGIVRIATPDEIKNRVPNLAIKWGDNKEIFNGSLTTINESNKSLYINSFYNLQTLNVSYVNYLRKDNVIYINGRFIIQISQSNSSEFTVVFKNVHMPITSTAGVGFSIDQNYSYVNKINLTGISVDNYLLYLTFKSYNFNFMVGSTYYVPFSLSYIYEL